MVNMYREPPSKGTARGGLRERNVAEIQVVPAEASYYGGRNDYYIIMFPILESPQKPVLIIEAP